MCHLLWTFLVISISHVFCCSELLVNLKHGGSLSGIYLTTNKGEPIRSFLGIPYALPPIGDLRFESPKPFPPWKGVRSAAKDGSSCTQTYGFKPDDPIEGSEDCLFLNVYTPPLARIPKRGLPVMFWIHGGAWLGGSNDHKIYGPDFLINNNVILVTINYRVGPLGFLSTETLDCPGNFGLKDQVEALRWVKRHISSFGGDAESITIFGESAGSASVGYLMYSNQAKGLFHKAIKQSGVIFNSWAQPLHKGVAQTRALKMAKLLNCDDKNDDWKQIITCLKKKDAYEITSKTFNFTEWIGYPYFVFQPVLEPYHKDAIIYKDPREDEVKSLDIPLLIGVTSGEGLMSTATLLGNEEYLNEVKNNVDTKFPLMLSYDHWDLNKQKEITEALENFYLKDGHTYNKYDHQNFTDMFSEAMFGAGVDEYLERRLSGKAASTFVYVYDFATNNSVTKFFENDEFYYGVAHCDDIEIFFPGFLRDQEIPSANLDIMRESLGKMWVHFATYGDPTPINAEMKWEPSKTYPWNYARLGSLENNKLVVLKNESGYARSRYEFWKSLKPHIESSQCNHSEL